MRTAALAWVLLMAVGCATDGDPDDGDATGDCAAGDPDCVGDSPDDGTDPTPGDGDDPESPDGAGNPIAPLPIGAACGADAECGSTARCIDNPSGTESTCRPSCAEAACSTAGDHCVGTTSGGAADGGAVCVPEPASNSGWRVRAVSAVVDGTINFDPGGNDPDPYVSLWLGPLAVGNTPTVNDSLTPIWNHVYPGLYAPDALRDVDLWVKDQDSSSDNSISYIAGLNLEPHWAGEVHRYVISHQGALELIIEIVPN